MAASEPKTEAKNETAPAGKPKRGKLLIIVGAALALAGAGGGAAAYFMLGKKDATEVAADDEGEAADPPAGKKAKKPKKKTGAPVFVELDMFTANLRDPEADRFIQVKLVAEVKDAAAGEMLKSMMPAVRNEVLLLLGSKEAKDVATREGKERLAGEIVAAANKTLEGTPAAGGVENVNFTHIIVQ